MAEAVDSTLTVLSFPVAYSFCASMMMSVLSVGVAVESGVPIRARKDWGVSDGIFGKFVGGGGGGIECVVGGW